jgi:glutamate synthase (NADPH/NADH) small chain
MGDPRGFLKVGRHPPVKRPIPERVRDYRHAYVPLPSAELRAQASRCMDCGVPFCSPGCPLGNLIPDWNDLVYRDRWQEAIDRLHATNNFPEFTGVLCPAPCEAACVLAINDDPVTIKQVELSIITRAFEEGFVRPQPPPRRTGRRVAVIGSGPAGLAAAQQLNRAGHLVTVFEKDDRLGGLLRYGIPDFKLEKWLVERRLDQLSDEGIAFAPGHHAGVNPTLAELRRDFDAILLAVGALEGRELPVPGRELDGVHLAMEYLTQENRRVAAGDLARPGTITARGKRVVILGGGDTSADCLGNVHREGPASVHVLTHGPRPPATPDAGEWPAWPFVLQVYPAHEEGGERRWEVMVTAFEGERRVEGVRLVGTRRTRGGRASPAPATEFRLSAELVLLAIGFEGPVRDRLLTELGVEFDSRGAIARDEHYRTSVPGVFAAGDATRGASLIVWAIAEGRQAARAIDLALTQAASRAGRAPG